jgi:hypothetical protein
MKRRLTWSLASLVVQKNDRKAAGFVACCCADGWETLGGFGWDGMRLVLAYLAKSLHVEPTGKRLPLRSTEVMVKASSGLSVCSRTSVDLSGIRLISCWTSNDTPNDTDAVSWTLSGIISSFSGRFRTPVGLILRDTSGSSAVLRSIIF